MNLGAEGRGEAKHSVFAPVGRSWPNTWAQLQKDSKGAAVRGVVPGTGYGTCKLQKRDILDKETTSRLMRAVAHDSDAHPGALKMCAALCLVRCLVRHRAGVCAASPRCCTRPPARATPSS